MKPTIAKFEPPKPSLKEALAKLVTLPEFQVFLDEASAFAIEPLNRILDSSHDHDVLMSVQGEKRAIRKFVNIKKLIEKLDSQDHAE